VKGLRWQTKVVSILAIGAIVDICSGVMTFMLLRAGFIDESFLTDMVTLEMINYACLIFIPTAILALRMLVQDLKSAHKLTSERMKAINRSGLVAVLNTDGIILDINENLAEFLEYSADEVRGNHEH
jgi:PAS domain-containing protein